MVNDIPAAGLAYWNGTTKVITVGNGVNLLNEAGTAESHLLLRFGPESDWLVGERFSYDAWDDKISEFAEDARSNAVLEVAIAEGRVWHYILDEPNHPTRYGGIIPFATVERMCMRSKELFPTWRTILRSRTSSRSCSSARSPAGSLHTDQRLTSAAAALSGA